MGLCHACGAETPDGARFCPACGARLEGPHVTRPSERRIVTTLFCDLVGFTAMCEQADPEDVDALLRSYHRLVRRVVEQFGGVVEKFIGDGVVGVFGISVAHEDDAERAVRAAIRLQSRVVELADPAGAPVKVRIGINTGETLVRRDVDPVSGESFLAGDAVNTASRLQAIAPPGGIVIGDLTHSLTCDVATSEAREPVRLKGKARPTRTWLVTGLVARPGVELQRSFRTPMVGREVESGLLQGLFEKVVASAAPQFAVVVAEAGLGKSRLLHELAGWLDARSDVLVWWRQAQCPAFGDGLSVWPIAQIVRQHTGIADADDPATMEAKLQAALDEAPDREWLAERLRPLLGFASDSAPKLENFAAWLRFLELLAQAKPTVLVIEDLHWASSLMAEFAAYVVATAADVPLLGLFTTRPEAFARPASPWAALTAAQSGPGVTRVELHPLSRPETERLVAALVQRDDTATRAAIVHRCGGNPLYAEELARLESNPASPAGDRHRPKAGPGGPEIPATLQSLIAARLDSLAPPLKAVLADAAVIGEMFDTDTLGLLGGASGPLDDLLSPLEARGFVRRLPGAGVAGDTRYAFQHAVTREVVYGLLPRPSRLERHERYGLWLLDRTSEEDELLAARHLRAALDLAGETEDATAVTRLHGTALDALTRAAEGMLALDINESERLARDALGLAATDDPRRVRLLVLLGRGLQRAGQPKEAERVLQEALDLFGPEDTAGCASALVHLAETLLELGEPRVVAVSDQALSLLGDSPSLELIAALELRAALHLTEDEPEQARALADAAVRAAEHLGLPQPLRALEMMAFADCLLGDVDAGMQQAESVLALLSSPGQSRSLPGIYGGLAELTLVYRGAAPALGVSEQGRRLAEERHDLTSWATCRVAEMEDTFFLGRWRGLAAALDDLAQTLGDNDSFFSLADVQDFRLLLSLVTETAPGDTPSEAVAEHAVALHGSLALSFLARALREAAAGRGDAALDLLDRMDRHTVNFSSIPSLMLWWSLGTRLALELGATELTVRLAGRLSASPAAPRPAAATASAILAEARDDLEAAASLYESAATAWTVHGVPFELAHALLGRARCLAGRKRSSQARPFAMEARDIFRRLGALPSLAVAEKLLAETVPVA